MKKFIIALSTLAAFNAFATNAFASEELYTSLNVEETAVEAPRTELVFQKAVGGITCRKTVLLTEEIKYACEVETKKLNSAKIYASLAVEEVPQPSTRLLLKFKKNSGAVTCEKVSTLATKSRYSCVFKI